MIARETYPLPEIANDVWEGLRRRPKALPPKLFYDAAGSALFDEITRLDEYYLTRTELEILEARGPELARRVGPEVTIIELGAGSGTKTRTVLRHLLGAECRGVYVPVDLSRSALEQARTRLRREFPRLQVKISVADYLQEPWAPSGPGPKLVLYLGSSIGNFEPMQGLDLLRRVGRRLAPGDRLLLGTDLRKDPAVLVPAYDDARGVTARFNKNVLARINRELGGSFGLEKFRHLALWNERESRIEMHLESLADQVVRIAALGSDVPFTQGERIHTENSYKYTVPGVRQMLAAGGFDVEHTWTDRRGWFAVHLARLAQG